MKPELLTPGLMIHQEPVSLHQATYKVLAVSPRFTDPIKNQDVVAVTLLIHTDQFLSGMEFINTYLLDADEDVDILPETR